CQRGEACERLPLHYCKSGKTFFLFVVLCFGETCLLCSITDVYNSISQLHTVDRSSKKMFSM
ncbi:unnamed protein product, partial [Tetraodon nigroviridis]